MPAGFSRRFLDAWNAPEVSPVASAKTQKPTVNDRLQKIGPELFGNSAEEAPPAPDWNQLQEWGIAALENSAEEVRGTNSDHRKSQARLGKARKDRNDKVNRIASGHRALRKSFNGTYGPASLPLVGLDAEPARALKAAREQDWAEMHTRSAWAGSHLSARRGDFRGALRQIKSAWTQLRYNGLAREFVAATLDRCQLICRGVEPRGDSPDDALKLITACLAQRADLSHDHRRGLKAMQHVLEYRPEDAFQELVDCRRSFIAPVPGAMAERIGAK